MRVRDSGMPDEAYWESLVDAPLAVGRFRMERFGDVAELGCGYGTFTEPVARAIAGTLYAFDIDPLMVERTRRRTDGLPVVCESRDVAEAGFGVAVDAVLLFNILHCERPVRLLRQAAAAAPTVLVTHWRHGQTPRGPGLDIRPRPEQVAVWAAEAGLRAGDEIDLPPWHYGLELARAADA